MRKLYRRCRKMKGKRQRYSRIWMSRIKLTKNDRQSTKMKLEKSDNFN
jgi:hypothetical protein